MSSEIVYNKTKNSPGSPENNPEEALPAERREGNDNSADLLSVVAELVVELEVEEPEEDATVREQRVDSPTAAINRVREMAEPQPVRATAILSTGREAVRTKFDLPTTLRAEMPTLKKRLLFVREFAVVGGDWAAFQQRFSATCELAGWTDVEALRALPNTLDDDALAAFYAIPPTDRTTLSQAYAQMAAIFDPPSNVHQKFATRRRGEIETPLTFCSVLISLAKATYPKMEQTGLDSLVLERLLPLAQTFFCLTRRRTT
ncbi:unnamed protein product [Lampetra fluviatilis]